MMGTRHNHAAHGRRHGQDGLGRRIEFADQDLALDFQADHEKEHGHETVVDPVEQGLGQDVAAEAHGHGRFPQGEIGRSQGRIGPDQGNQGTGNKDDAARSLDMAETAKRGQGLLQQGQRPGRG